MVACSIVICCAKFEITTMNIWQDIATFVFGQIWWVKWGGGGVLESADPKTLEGDHMKRLHVIFQDKL